MCYSAIYLLAQSQWTFSFYLLRVLLHIWIEFAEAAIQPANCCPLASRQTSWLFVVSYRGNKTSGGSTTTTTTTTIGRQVHQKSVDRAHFCINNKTRKNTRQKRRRRRRNEVKSLLHFWTGILSAQLSTWWRIISTTPRWFVRSIGTRRSSTR